MDKKRKQKNLVIGGLLAIVLVMAVGYAAFATNLNINGTAETTSTWNVKITNISPNATVTNTGTEQNPIYASAGDISHSITNNDLTANFNTALVSPGDSVVYTITVENLGSLDAELSTITTTDSNNDAISFVVNGIEEGEVLAANSDPKTFTVTVTYVESENQGQPANTNSSFSLTLNYTQYAGNGSGGGGSSSTTAASYLTTLAQTDSTLIDDGTTDHNIRYTGKNVNNYVCLDSAEEPCSDANLYRIIGVFNNIKTTTEGTGETRVKLIKATSIGDNYWNNSTNNNNWTKASLNTTLQALPIASNTLIDNAVWNLGGYNTNNVTTSAMYGYERGNLTGNSNAYPTTWQGKVALMYPSDYGYASSACYSTYNLGGSNNTDKADYRNDTCTGSNWLFLGSNEWTLSPNSSGSDIAFSVLSAGRVNNNNNVNHNRLAVRPAVYLKSDVEIVTDGRDGSSSSPYLLQ